MATTDAALTPFVPTSIEQASKLAAQLAQSALLPDALRGKPADVLVTLITGHELGLSPMQAIRGLHVIKGKAVMSADLTVALVKKHAECLYFKLVETTAQRAVYATERKNEGETKMAFAIEDAQRAGLTGGDNWKKYPAAMLRARCASALARAVYPDLTLGVYDPDEAREFSNGSGNGEPARVEVDVTPPAEGKRTATTALKEKLAAKVAREPVEADTVPPPRPTPPPARKMPPIVDECEPPPPGDEDVPWGASDNGRAAEDAAQEDGEKSPVLVPFGKNKGTSISDVDKKELAFLEKYASEAVDNPEKARFQSQNQALLDAVRAERARR
jgi:hypothetical protein